MPRSKPPRKHFTDRRKPVNTETPPPNPIDVLLGVITNIDNLHGRKMMIHDLKKKETDKRFIKALDDTIGFIELAQDASREQAITIVDALNKMKRESINEQG